jgi:hypothetical protein
MANDSVVEMNIFGRVSDPEATWNVALSASAASASAPWSNGFDSAAFGDMLAEAEKEGRAITIEIHDDWDVFEELRNGCQAAGLSYVAYTAEGGEPGWSGGIAWRPEMADEFEFQMNGDQPKLMLSVDDVQQAVLKGLWAVRDLVTAAVSNTRIGSIEIAPGFTEVYVEHTGYAIAAPAP